MQDLPVDISLYLARFIPSATLCKMHRVNRAFLQLAMEERRKCFRLGNVERMLDDVVELREKNLLHKIHTLRIFPEDLMSYFREEAKMQNAQSQFSRWKWHSAKHGVQKATLNVDAIHNRLKRDFGTSSLLAIITRIITACTILACEINFEGQARSCETAKAEAKQWPLICIISQIIAPTLQSLVIKGELPAMASGLLSSIQPLSTSNLLSLELEISYNHHHSLNSRDTWSFWKFISLFQSSLESLSIALPFREFVPEIFMWYWNNRLESFDIRLPLRKLSLPTSNTCQADLPRILSKFPHLVDIRIGVDFVDVRLLKTLLELHPQLQELYFSTTRMNIRQGYPNHLGHLTWSMDDYMTLTRSFPPSFVHLHIHNDEPRGPNVQTTDASGFRRFLHTVKRVEASNLTKIMEHGNGKWEISKHEKETCICRLEGVTVVCTFTNAKLQVGGAS